MLKMILAAIAISTVQAQAVVIDSVGTVALIGSDQVVIATVNGDAAESLYKYLSVKEDVKTDASGMLGTKSGSGMICTVASKAKTPDLKFYSCQMLVSTYGDVTAK